LTLFIARLATTSFAFQNFKTMPRATRGRGGDQLAHFAAENVDALPTTGRFFIYTLPARLDSIKQSGRGKLSMRRVPPVRFNSVWWKSNV